MKHRHRKARLLPDPLSQACDETTGYLFERGIIENLANRLGSGSSANLKFDLASDGDCRTLDGNRQELLALLSDILDGTQVPVCVKSTIDGDTFECCAQVTVRNSGNR